MKLNLLKLGVSTLYEKTWWFMKLNLIELRVSTLYEKTW